MRRDFELMKQHNLTVYAFATIRKTAVSMNFVMNTDFSI